jgi:hypothetical protein
MRPSAGPARRDYARIAHENFLWGAPRIHGELLMLGFSVSQATVSRYLPAPSRRPTQSWRTFLRNQASAFGQYSEERSSLHGPAWTVLLGQAHGISGCAGKPMIYRRSGTHPSPSRSTSRSTCSQARWKTCLLRWREGCRLMLLGYPTSRKSARSTPQRHRLIPRLIRISRSCSD